MLFTKTYLSNQIANIKCAYATYMSKYSKALSYGLTSEKCLYINMVVLKWYIKLLERFQNEGVICNSTPPCQLENSTFSVTEVCIINNEEKRCVPIEQAVEDIYISKFIFGTETVQIQDADGLLTKSYEYDLSTGVLIIDEYVLKVTFNEDCTNVSFTINLDEYTIIYNAITISSQNNNYTCEWSSKCVTELETQEIIKHSYSILKRNCNC